MIKLRDDQAALFSAAQLSIRSGRRAVCLQAPTGFGKGWLLAHIAMKAADRRTPTLIVVHRIELLEDLSARLNRLAVPHGVIAAGWPETDATVKVGLVGTIVNRIDRAPDDFKLLIFDECHHAVAGQWRRIREAYPGAWTVGLTATPERLDGQGLGDVFDDLICGPPMAELMADGRLSRYALFAPAASPDFSRVKIRAGDFAVDQAAAIMRENRVISSAVEEYARLCPGRPALAFAVDIQHSQDLAAAFRAAGFRAAHVDGDTRSAQRRTAVAALARGDLDIISNVALFTEGVDLPALDAVLMCRPTASIGLYLQMVGRALRTAPAKERALILDFVGNVDRHGPPDEPRIWSLESKKRKAPAIRSTMRRCEACSALTPRSRRACDQCGAELRLTQAERHELIVKIEKQLAANERATVSRMSFSEQLDWAAGDLNCLRLVAGARGYKRGWAYHRHLETLARASIEE